MWKFAIGLLSALVILRLAGAWRWRADTRAAVAAMERPQAPIAYDDADYSGLPAPVRRYFERALARRGTLIRGVRHKQRGEFQVNGWHAMTATQWHGAGEPRFVWDARIRLAPGVSVDVRDAYLRGEGVMKARVWGLWPVVTQQGGRELAAGALQRYLGEAVWFPTALLPGQGVTWTPIDGRRARATLVDGEVRAELDFQFNEAGDVTGATTPARFREVNGQFVATPWESRCWAWAEREGMRIPLESEAAWVIDGKREPYWRARIETITFE